MKDFLLSIFSFPGLVIFIYFIGLVSSSLRHKVKFFSTGLFIMFLLSLPIFSKILSYPLLYLPKHLASYNMSNLNTIGSVTILTGGIYKNVMGKWQPSKSTEERVFLAKNILRENTLPLIVSGGFTKKNAPSEAKLTISYYNLSNAIVDSNSLNTYQSSLNLKNYCKKLNAPMLLITDKFHSLRSYLSFKSQGCTTIPYNHSNKISLKDFLPSTYGFSYFNKTLYEYIGILYYMVTFKINVVNLF